MSNSIPYRLKLFASFGVSSLVKFILILLPLTLALFYPSKAHAAVLAQQTERFSEQLNVWQTLQELGNNLEGKAGTFTFRINTGTIPYTQQFNFTAQNSKIYDKSNNTYIHGCVPTNSDPADQLRGLIFNQTGVPAGYTDVSIDFSCNNYNFIKGRNYLIFITNANRWPAAIKFASSAYGAVSPPGSDFFTGGGLRYAYDNSSCSPNLYILNSQKNNSGCNIFTTTRDDLYFTLTDTPPAPPTPLKTPLVFIPGIGGSELQVKTNTVWSKPDGHGGTFNRIYPAGEKVWVNEAEGASPGDDDYFDILRLKPDGQTPEADLELTGNIYPGSYQPTINFFTSNGYTLNKDFFVFPYDWRKDISLTSPLLDQRIESIKQQTGSQKVDIVAHSMGGLVARNYIADPAKAQKVRKLITLGTPHLGAIITARELIYGGCFTRKELENLPVCFGLTNSEVQDIVHNMTGVFELIPTKKYFDLYTGEDKFHPRPYRDDRDIDNNGVTGQLDYDQTKTLLTNLGQNTSLFNLSEPFHNLDNNLSNTNGVETAIISGSGIPTIGQIIEGYFINFAGIKISHKDEIKINGDDTVPLFSSSLTDSLKNISLRGSTPVYYTNQAHNALVAGGPALSLVKNILDSSNQLPEGVSAMPYSIDGDMLSVHSPVNIHVYDQNGNHTGLTANGDIEENIPGSSYETLDDAKFIWLPNSGHYNVRFEATDQGSFDFKIRHFESDNNDKTILYKNIPLTANTKGETVFDTSSTQPPILQIDQDGNGETDSQVNPTSTLEGDSSYDQAPPKTAVTLDGDKGNNNWFKSDVLVTLTGQDETGGSGIYKIEYSLDNGQTIQTYTTPFTISPEGINKLKFRAIDNAGNEENPQEEEIKIDKTAPTVNISANPNILWPPNKKLVKVTIDGSAQDNISGISSKQFTFFDEYQSAIQTITNFGQTLNLEAWREGNDQNGREYKVTATAEDQAGNKAEAATLILAPHDRR